MRFIRGILPTVGLSVLLIISLSFLPSLMKKENGPDLSVFNISEKKTLSEQNIVDYFTNYPLRCEISHIEWRDGILSLQLHNLSNEEELYKDIFLILKECFVERTNVNVVNFSVQSEREENQYLEIKKEDISVDRQMSRRSSDMSFKEYVSQFLKDE